MVNYKHDLLVSPALLSLGSYGQLTERKVLKAENGSCGNVYTTSIIKLRQCAKSLR